jgi:alkanesulfonate monooxygenase SsuD/methylene tetrahydromethanopterin reductase-like flavin-dependent oxidoreductase (luciferase family)
VEIGLGIDSRFTLSDSDQRRIAREAAGLGYQSLWTPIAAERTPFDLCELWYRASGLATGIAVAPISSWTPEQLAALAAETGERCEHTFRLGVGSGRRTGTVIREMRLAREALDIGGVPIYLGALGPQMLRLGGELYDGVALNWCSSAQVAWSRTQVAAGARRVGLDPSKIRIHEYIRVCVDEDESAARSAFAKMVMTYAMARPGSDKTKGYRAHFARMGFDEILTDLERRRASGADDDELARRFPDGLLATVGYWGRPEDAREAFLGLADGLDIAIVRLVPASGNGAAAVRLAMEACAPG